MKKIFFGIGIIIILLVVWVFLQNRQNLNENSITPNTPSESDTNIGGDWSLSEYRNNQGEIISVQQEIPITITFDNIGRVGGSGGCNSYGAAYEMNGTQLRVGDIESTMIYCETTSELEGEFMNLLGMADSYQVENGQLIIFDNDKVEILRFNKLGI